MVLSSQPHLPKPRLRIAVLFRRFAPALLVVLASTVAFLTLESTSLGAAEQSFLPPEVDARPSFVEDFNGTALDTDRWRTTFKGNPGHIGPIGDRNLWGNAEQQIYFDKGFLGLGVQPFSVADGMLTITAEPMSPPVLAGVKAAIATMPPSQRDSPISKVRFSSGMITTRKTFSQTYGYFEMRARFSAGRGLWPAFWLLASDDSWPPEIDIFEILGHDPNMVYSTVHSNFLPKQSKGVQVPETADHFHRYGALWLPDRIVFFVDGKKTSSATTPRDAFKPMHIVADFAVGGIWPGNPDASTHFPAHMDIDYIKSWPLKGDRNHNAGAAPPAH